MGVENRPAGHWYRCCAGWDGMCRVDSVQVTPMGE